MTSVKTPAQRLVADVRLAARVHAVPISRILREANVSEAVFYRWGSGYVYSPKVSTAERILQVLQTLNDNGKQAVAESVADESVLPITQTR